MVAILAGPVRWSLDLPACLTSPWIVPAISTVSEAEVAASLWPAGEVSFMEARLDFVTQFLGIGLPGICEPLNRTCMQP